MNVKRFVSTVGLVASVSVIAGLGGAEAQTVLIRGGTILTVTNGTMVNGDILVRDGKIAEIGANISFPEGALVIDASGQFVMPGIIDAHSHIAAESINEGSVAVSSMTGIKDVLDPTDINIYRELAGGVTTSNVLHGSANPIGGKNAVIKHRWGSDAEGLLFKGALPGIKFALRNARAGAGEAYLAAIPRRGWAS